MNVRSRLRRTPAYALWRSYRQREQLARFRRLIDRYLGRQGHSVPSYDDSHTRNVLALKQRLRLPLVTREGKPNILAFGTSDWEQSGLWPSFQRVSGFTLFDYQLAQTPRHRRIPDESERNRLAAAFLTRLDGLEPACKPTLAFFYAAGTYISSNLLHELHQRGIWTVVMSLDDKQQLAEGGDQMRVAAHCDLYWTVWKTGSEIVLGLDGNPWYAAEAADPAFYRPLSVARDLEIVFVGQCYGLRAELVRYMRRRGFAVEAFGAGWAGGFVSFEKAIELYSRAQIVLGVGGVGQMAGVKHLKGRDFEVPMCGAVYLTSYNPELCDHFRIGEEILCYSSLDECADVAHWLLRHPERAEEIRQAALRRSLSDHTWDVRLLQMFSLWPRTAGAYLA